MHELNAGAHADYKAFVNAMVAAAVFAHAMMCAV